MFLNIQFDTCIMLIHMSNTPQLPFRIYTDGELPQWRTESFYTKEPETIAWLNFFSLKTEYLVDVGANIGIYSLYWLSKDIKNFCISCEPFSANSRMLRKNLELNNYQSRCLIVCNPLSQNVQVVTAINEDKRIGSSGYKIETIPDRSREMINTQTIDALLEKIEKPCILKIDTDGFDFEILKGGIQSLSQQKIISVLIESSEREHRHIEYFLSQKNLVRDVTFENLENHSDVRRISKGKIERNRVYSLQA
jgi:FkbM family methyltransferase